MALLTEGDPQLKLGVFSDFSHSLSRGRYVR